MPRDKLLGERFKIKKYKWYIVDLRNFHNPVLIRKHLETKEQAIRFKEKYYYGDNYDIIYWKKAKKYGLKDLPKIRTHKHHTAKYDYPSDCKSQYQRQLFRNVQRNKIKKIMSLPKVTESIVWEIIDDKPTLLVKRITRYSDNHWVYSKPVKCLEELKRIYKWPKDLKHLSNIVRVLEEYYDTGLYPIHKVAIFIYKKWGPRIRRHSELYLNEIPNNIERVRKEFKARGFIEDSKFDPIKDSYIRSIKLLPILTHPERCWQTGDERELYEHYVMDFQVKMGIPGWTMANQGSLARGK